MFIRFDRIHERDGQMDRQTERDTAQRHRPRLCIASRGKDIQPCYLRGKRNVVLIEPIAVQQSDKLRQYRISRGVDMSLLD